MHRAWADETVNVIFNSSAMLARKLGMQIVAEGVEDQADWDHVLRAKCDLAQGMRYAAEGAEFIPMMLRGLSALRCCAQAMSSGNRVRCKLSFKNNRLHTFIAMSR